MSFAPTFKVLLVQEDVVAARTVIETFARGSLDCQHIPTVDTLETTLSAVRPDLIVVDSSPGKRPPGALNLAQKDNYIPVILLTDTVDAEQNATWGHGLVESYILKPVDPKMLMLRVLAHLRGMEPPKSSSGRKGSTEWLPFGWSSCNACNFRGRTEMFRLSVPRAEGTNGTIGQTELVFDEAVSASLIENAVGATRATLARQQHTLRCPRCGQPAHEDGGS